MVIESQLPVIWDSTKTKHYSQEIPIYLIRNIFTYDVMRREREGFCQIKEVVCKKK